MIRSHRFARLSAAFVTGIAATILVAGAALAHPESEGDHAGSCIVTVEPGSVMAGGTFTVVGNFGGDADTLTVSPALPDTAVELPDDTTVLAGVILVLVGITVVGERLGMDRR